MGRWRLGTRLAVMSARASYLSSLVMDCRDLPDWTPPASSECRTRRSHRNIRVQRGRDSRLDRAGDDEPSCLYIQHVGIQHGGASAGGHQR
jgi:hypothetical protein